MSGHEDALYLDLASTAEDADELFLAVAADVVDEARDVSPEQRPDRLVRLLRRWRWFWGLDPTRMSAQDALGLFGELWFLVRHAGVDAASLKAWTAGAGARHDFQWPGASIEVKTTAVAGPVVHTIQSLEQLAAPEVGELLIFSLHLQRDALAGNTLHSLADAAAQAVSEDVGATETLHRRLAERGYSPVEHELSVVPYRVLDEGLYVVGDGFPRLTTASFGDGLPAAVVGVSYRLDMAACASWRTGLERVTRR